MILWQTLKDQILKSSFVDQITYIQFVKLDLRPQKFSYLSFI